MKSNMQYDIILYNNFYNHKTYLFFMLRDAFIAKLHLIKSSLKKKNIYFLHNIL